VAGQQRSTRGRGPNDPERRQRIAEAAIAVIGESGLSGITHRAVAQRAGIPLGSTTYYFGTLEDLVQAAFELQAERDMAETTEWFKSQAADSDLAAVLASRLEGYLDDDSGRIVVLMDLYLAAIHRPALRPLATRWSSLMTDLLAARMARPAAAAISAVFDGLLIWALTSGSEFDRNLARQTLRKVVSGARR
jgi:TetR/AcrR family transcriptional regulator, regulator of biofilm formation and stress response